MNNMTPKQRLLAAMRRQEVDYIPCAPWFWSSPEVPEYQWRNESERLEIMVDRLGVDTYHKVNFSQNYNPEIKEQVWQEHPAGEIHPLIHKEIHTPKGVLSACVKRTEDWPHGEDIPLHSDFNVSRFVKPWLQSLDDVEKYAYLEIPPRPESMKRFHQLILQDRKIADQWQVPLYASCGLGLTAVILLFGAQDAIFISKDHPEVIDRFLDIEHQQTMRKLEVLLESGVDIICRNGFYETTDFWSPQQYRKFLMSRLKEEIDLVHSKGKVVTYTVCTGIMPMIQELAELKFDCLDGIEPVLGNQDMEIIARDLGKERCIWTGPSAPIHIGRGTPDEVREAVRKATKTFGRRGFILAATPSIRPQWPWENVMAMLDEWKKLR
jgi:uroporphyrinogen-III decarboxylase